MISHKKLRYKIGVYKITNIKNNKVYIGSSCNSLYKRLSSHRELLRKDKHTNKHLQRAWNKYGEDKFTFDVIEICKDKEETLKQEEFYINYLQTFISSRGYNIYRFAYSNIGNKWSEEARLNRKGYRKGIPKSDETKLKMSIAAKGRIVKESTKEKLRNLNITPIVMLTLNGKYIREFRNCKEASLYFNLVPSSYVCSVIHGKRKTCKGYRLMLKSKYNPDNIKRVVSGNTTEVNQYDLQGNFIKTFLSMKEAETEINVKGGNANISACCKGKKRSAYGFIWKYKK